MDDLDFTSDDFADILAKDNRYHPRAYALLTDVIHYLGESGAHYTGEEILEEFRSRTLDLYGPLSYIVLTTWGVKATEDIGEMMFNLVDAKRVERDDDDSIEAFASGYDFRETFLAPYDA